MALSPTVAGQGCAQSRHVGRKFYHLVLIRGFEIVYPVTSGRGLPILDSLRWPAMTGRALLY